MKKKSITLLLAIGLSVISFGCGKESESLEPVEDNNNQQVEQEESEDNATNESDSETNTATLDTYINGVNQLSGKEFSVNAVYKDGIQAAVDSESGTIYWEGVENTDNLVVCDYDGENNKLIFNSMAATDNGEIDTTSSVEINDFIPFCDELRVVISSKNLPSGKNIIMVESWGAAYTFADGVRYEISLIEVADNGDLDLFYQDRLSGSGDEDITSELRPGFNKAFESDYSADEFNDTFYTGNLVADKEKLPIEAEITFKSDSSYLADAGDWDGANEIASQIYDSDDINSINVYWGIGKFGK